MIIETLDNKFQMVEACVSIVHHNGTIHSDRVKWMVRYAHKCNHRVIQIVVEYFEWLLHCLRKAHFIKEHHTAMRYVSCVWNRRQKKKIWQHICERLHDGQSHESIKMTNLDCTLVEASLHL